MATYTNPAPGRVSSAFTPARRHPVTGKVQPHEGTDVANATGTPVAAVHDGVVTRSETLSAAYDHLQWVWVAGDGVETRYLHLSRRDVRVGARVRAGDRLGLMGASGRVTGPHLHLEVHVGGRAIDPVQWLVERGVTLGVDPAPGDPIPLPKHLPEDTMIRTTRKRTKNVPLPLKKWKTVPLNNNGDLSAVTSPGRATITSYVALSGVPKGAEVQLRSVVVETDAKGASAKTISRGPIVEVLGSGGQTFGQIVAPVDVPEVHGSRQRRARLEIYATTPGVTLTSVTTITDQIPA